MFWIESFLKRAHGLQHRMELAIKLLLPLPGQGFVGWRAMLDLSPHVQAMEIWSCPWKLPLLRGADVHRGVSPAVEAPDASLRMGTRRVEVGRQELIRSRAGCPHAWTQEQHVCVHVDVCANLICWRNAAWRRSCINEVSPKRSHCFQVPQRAGEGKGEFVLFPGAGSH